MDPSLHSTDHTAKRPRLSDSGPSANDLLHSANVLIADITNCYTEEAPITQKQSAAATALGKLGASPELRNVLMGLEPNHHPAPSLDIVLQCNTGPLTAQPIEIMNNGTLFRRDKRGQSRVAFLKKLLLDPAFKAATHYPEFYTYKFGEKFVINLLGEDVIQGRQVLPLTEIKRRLDFVENSLKAGNRPTTAAHGSLWVQNLTPAAIHNLILSLQTQFIQRLIEVKDHGYLDALAPCEYPQSDAPLDPIPSYVASHDLTSRESGRLLGTVFEWQGCLSPAFLQYLHSSVESFRYIRDPRTQKDRLLRFASTAHTQSKPQLFKLGQPPNATVFESDYATPVERDLLNIVNKLMDELYEFIYNGLCRSIGIANAQMLSPKKRRLDMVCHTLGDLRTGNYGLHDDSGEMITDEDVPGCGSFNLLVPTIAIQNRNSSDVAIHWYEREIKPKSLVTVLSSVDSLHWQAFGVQRNSKHHVPVPICPPLGPTLPDERLVLSFRPASELQESGSRQL